MPRPTPTEIIINEDGTETHESWVVIRANNVSGRTRLFDSEITHDHYIQINVTRCTRSRDLHRDWIFGTEILMELELSQAQWGAFVSSFGQGTGVPATLTRLTGLGAIPGAITESRLAASAAEVRDAGNVALAEITEAYDEVIAAFDAGAGKKAMREALGKLGNRMGNAPKNMEFAATSLTEHFENVIVKARADIEGAVLNAQRAGIELDAADLPMLGTGEPS